MQKKSYPHNIFFSSRIYVLCGGETISTYIFGQPTWVNAVSTYRELYIVIIRWHTRIVRTCSTRNEFWAVKFSCQHMKLHELARDNNAFLRYFFSIMDRTRGEFCIKLDSRLGLLNSSPRLGQHHTRKEMVHKLHETICSASKGSGDGRLVALDIFAKNRWRSNNRLWF